MITRFTSIFGIDRNQGKRLPTDLVCTENHHPLTIAVGKGWTISGTPLQVLASVLNQDKEGPFSLQYVEFFCNTSTQLRTYSRKEVLALIQSFARGTSPENTHLFMSKLK